MKSKLFLLITAALLVICGCSDFPKEEEAPTGLSVSVVSLSFPETSSTQAITIRSGSKWTVSSIPEWVSVQSIDNKFAFSYQWSVTLVSTENDGYDRNGTIVFSASGETVSVPVEQKGKKGAYVAVESVSLGVSEITLTEGDTYTLTATISPDNASDKSVTWSSSNTDVVTVSSSGIVTALAVGSAMITVTTQDGGKVTTCSVTVQAKTIPVTGISLDKTSMSLYIGGTEKLTATVSPLDATNKNVTWSSSNLNVATVDSNGNVSAINVGTTIISVTTEDGGKTATCSTTVNPIAVTNVSLNQTSLTMTVGDTQTLTASVTPSNATDKSVSWSSSNTAVATVSSSGLVSAKAAGSATITVTTNDGGKNATCSVTVQNPIISVTGVSLSSTSLSMTVGDTHTLTATITPSNATDKTVSWSSSNTAVATVSSSGIVTAKTVGSATITVTTNDGGKKATCSVSINAATIPVPDAIDLGLSVKWASFNLGASKPEDYGYYYAWGAIGTCNYYDWSTCPFYAGNTSSFSKYNDSDNKLVLDSADDAAHVNLGGNWRMPTVAELRELANQEWDESQQEYVDVEVDNCTWEWTSIGGVYGCKVTSNKPGYEGNYIFIPAAGHMEGAGLKEGNSVGVLWTASRKGLVKNAQSLLFSSNRIPGPGLWLLDERWQGKSIRPVYEIEKVSVTGVSLNKTSLTLTEGDTYTLTASVTPSNATNKSVSWVSSNTAIATVSSSGLVTAKAVGTATITVTTNDGGKTATCAVTVLSPLNGGGNEHTGEEELF